MGFLIRTAFWFSLVLLFLPLGTGPDGESRVSPLQALFAAREAVGDIAAICERKPEVCETGKAAMQTIGERARESARIAYEVLDQNFGKPDTATQTGSVPAGDDAPALPTEAAPLPAKAPVLPAKTPAH